MFQLFWRKMKYKMLKTSTQSGQVLFNMAQWFWKRLKREKFTLPSTKMKSSGISMKEIFPVENGYHTEMLY